MSNLACCSLLDVSFRNLEFCYLALLEDTVGNLHIWAYLMGLWGGTVACTVVALSPHSKNTRVSLWVFDVEFVGAGLLQVLRFPPTVQKPALGGSEM